MRVAVVVASAIALVGCGAGTSAVATGPAPGRAVAASTTPTTTAATSHGSRARTRTIDLDTTVWWGRFELRFGEATFAPSGFGSSGTLTIATSFTNHSADRAKLDAADVAIVAGADRYPPGLGRLPEVTGGATQGGTLGFWLPHGFDPARIQLVFGSPDTNQSVVPLGAPASTLTFAPVPVAAHARARTSDVALTLTGGTLSGSYRPNERGSGLLRLAFDVAFNGTSALGKLVDASDFAITLPDGTVVTGAAVASDDIVMEVVQAKQTRSGSQMTFVVPVPLSGKYSVTYTDQETGQTASMSFTIR